MKIKRLLLLALSLGMVGPAFATTLPVVFNFNSNNTGTNPNLSLSGSYGNGLGATASSSTIQTYMTNVLHNAGFGAASATVSGALGTATYNGEGYVYGPTLGTSENATSYTDTTHNDSATVIANKSDGFIINNNFGVNGGSASDSFSVKLNNFAAVSQLSFDFEIFPDVNCQYGSSCANSGGTSSNWPDMKLYVDGVATPVWSVLAAASPVSGKGPQKIGTSGLLNLNLAAGTHTLKFSDWPAEVGIDNLKLYTVPEPSTLPLVGLSIAALVMVRRRLT